MKHLTTKSWLPLILLVLLLMPVAVASAATTVGVDGPGPGDQFVFGSSYTLRSGETLSGDLVVFGGSARAETGSTVKGDIAVFGGNANIDGLVKGDIAVVGGSLNLGPNAVVNGDAVSLGGSIIRQPGSIIEGDIDAGPAQGWEPDIPRLEGIREVRSVHRGFGSWILGYFLGGLSAVAIAALLAALGVLLLVLIPEPTERVLDVVEANTGVSFGFGFLAAVLSAPILILLTITICLSPLAAVLGVLLIIALLFGWLVVGWRLGKWVLQLLKAKQSTPILEMVVGVATLTFLWRIPAVIPCVGWFFSLLVLIIAGSIGLGAVGLTRFGTRSFPPNGRTAVTDYDAIEAESSIPTAPPETSEPPISPLPEPDDIDPFA